MTSSSASSARRSTRGSGILEHGAYADYEADELPKLAERIEAAGRERRAKK
jgi:hypothetical protein